MKLLSTVDTNAKTISVTLNGISDPVLAIGGTTTATTTTSGGVPVALWAVLLAIAVIVLVVAVFLVARERSHPRIIVVSEGSPSSGGA